MAEFETYNEYIISLDDAAKDRATDFIEVSNSVLKLDNFAHLSSFLFTPDQTDHPEYEDAAAVFSKAFNRLYVENPLFGNEVPLFYLGYHALNVIGMKRIEQGFLLTDQALYMQDDFSITGSISMPRGYPLPSRTSDIPLYLSTIMSKFKVWDDWAKMAQNTPEEIRDQITEFLSPVIEKIIQQHQRHGSQREYVATAPSVQTLSRQYQDLIDPENPGKNAKKLAKAIDKFKVPASEPVRFAALDTPIFGAPYGLVVTSTAIYTRDLMEDAVRLPLTKIDASSLRIDGNDISSNLGPIFLPASIDKDCKSLLLELIHYGL